MGKSAILQFIEKSKEAFDEGIFVRIILSSYKGEEKDLKKITVRQVVIKREERFSFTYSYKTRDVVKNFSLEESMKKIVGYLEEGFSSAMLLTTEYDFSYPALKRTKPSITEQPDPSHDREKNRHVETKGRSYLQALKITDAQGVVFKNAQDKYKQIDRYIDILSSHFKNFAKDKPLRIVDMGSGKGYLTFALYDYLTTQGWKAHLLGVEMRQDLVDLCNGIAKESGFGNLSFVKGSVDDYAEKMDVLIALHACDTATDDAIAKGIDGEAALIVVAPCCHKQIRREIEQANVKNNLAFLTTHGIFMERQAEMVTDGLRALILQYHGYSTKVFEFISDAHTPKNVMIVATRTDKEKQSSVLEKIKAAKKYFGIITHHLETKIKF